MKCLCGLETARESAGCGWKKNCGREWCPDCWSKAYAIRAVTIPVAGPWSDELRAALKTAWAASTAVANETIRLLARADVVRTPSMTKIPPMPKMPTAGKGSLYGIARSVAPEMDSSTAACLARKVESLYRAARFDVVWKRERALQTFKYPMPYPIPNQCWRAYKGDGGELMVSLPLVGERRELRLRGGHEFERQRKMIGQIISGEAVQGEMTLFEQAANSNDNRPTADAKSSSRLVVKMVAWFPIPAAQERIGGLIVTTSKDSMVHALNGKDEKLFTIHADHVKRWGAAHSAQLQRWSDDTKRELSRPVPFAERREKACAKHARRMKTAVDQIAAQIVNYADRRKFASIIWMPTDDRFVESFQWFAFVTAMSNRCNAVGIVFDDREKKAKEEAKEEAKNVKRAKANSKVG